jgi:hypothetical protein
MSRFKDRARSRETLYQRDPDPTAPANPLATATPAQASPSRIDGVWFLLIPLGIIMALPEIVVTGAAAIALPDGNEAQIAWWWQFASPMTAIVNALEMAIIVIGTMFWLIYGKINPAKNPKMPQIVRFAWPFYVLLLLSAISMLFQLMLIKDALLLVQDVLFVYSIVIASYIAKVR